VKLSRTEFLLLVEEATYAAYSRVKPQPKTAIAHFAEQFCEAIAETNNHKPLTSLEAEYVVTRLERRLSFLR
jgi:hypothetical protein